MLVQRKKPCTTCPYVRSTPKGIWSEDEYRKLPNYDGHLLSQSSKVFHCHHTTDEKNIICQGWLDCHEADRLLAVRIASAMGKLPEDFDTEPSTAHVYRTGHEAMTQGLSEIDHPSKTALKKIEQLRKQGKEYGS